MKEKIITQDSATVIINTLAQQKIAAGIRVFNLSVGEPKLPPHPLLIKAVDAALQQGKTLYPAVSGIPELKKLATKWMNDIYHCQFSADECLVMPGGKFGIYLLLQLLLQPDDEVIIPAPYWVSYPAITALFNGIPIIIETHEKNGWKINPYDLEKCCNSKTKILMLNNAANPTGALYSKDELATLLHIAKEKKLLVISDEVYSGLTYDNHTYISCGSFSEHKDHVIVIQSCSKNFAMTGWRIGFVFAPMNIIKPLTSLVSQSTSGVATLSQWASVAAFQNGKIITDWVHQAMLERRNILLAAFQTHFNLTITPPISALYLFISLEQLGIKHNNCVQFCKDALEQANVALVPGIAFGKEGFIRISFGGDPDDLTDGVRALARFCQ